MCSLFIVVGNHASLLEIPDMEPLNILSITCNTIDRLQRCTEISAQMMEETCNIKKDSNSNPVTDNNKDYILGYILQALNRSR